MKCLVFIGMPGSGKSTIANELSKRYNISYISSGDIARRMAERYREVADGLNRGDMAPEQMMRDEIFRTIFALNENTEYFILDGFPRFEDQYHWLKREFKGIDFVCVYIICGIGTASRRVASRSRDDVAAFDRRLHYYLQNTYPITGMFKSIIIIDNNDDINDFRMNYMVEHIKREVGT